MAGRLSVNLLTGLTWDSRFQTWTRREAGQRAVLNDNSRSLEKSTLSVRFGDFEATRVMSLAAPIQKRRFVASGRLNVLGMVLSLQKARRRAVRAVSIHHSFGK